MERRNDFDGVMTAELIVTVDGMQCIYLITEELFDGVPEHKTQKRLFPISFGWYGTGWYGMFQKCWLSLKNGRFTRKFVFRYGISFPIIENRIYKRFVDV